MPGHPTLIDKSVKKKETLRVETVARDFLYGVVVMRCGHRGGNRALAAALETSGSDLWPSARPGVSSGAPRNPSPMVTLGIRGLGHLW